MQITHCKAVVLHVNFSFTYSQCALSTRSFSYLRHNYSSSTTPVYPDTKYLTPYRLKETFFCESSLTSLRGELSAVHMAAAHFRAASCADLMLSTRPLRKRRRDADSYVETEQPYILVNRNNIVLNKNLRAYFAYAHLSGLYGDANLFVELVM